jgi:hypothetical protein
LLPVEATSIAVNVLVGFAQGATIVLNAAEAETAAVRATIRGEELARRLNAGRLHHLDAHLKGWARFFIGHLAAEFLGVGLEFSDSVRAFAARHPSVDIFKPLGPVSWLSPNVWTPLVTAPSIAMLRSTTTTPEEKLATR